MIPDYPRLVPGKRVNKGLNLAIAAAARLLGPRIWTPFRGAVNEYFETYLRFTEAATEYYGSRVFIDGGKSLVRVWLNGSLRSDVGTKLIHLIRDPRAFHASNLKNEGAEFSLEESCRRWKERHRRIAWVGRVLGKESYFRVRYEDLCLGPEKTLRSIIDFLGVEHVDLLATAGEAREQHVIGSRTKQYFDGSVKFSQRWRERLSEDECGRILTGTAPLSRRFGYR